MLYIIITINPLYDASLSNCKFVLCCFILKVLLAQVLQLLLGFKSKRLILFFNTCRLNMEAYRALRLIMPDPVVLLVSIVALAYFTKTLNRPNPGPTLNHNVLDQSRNPEDDNSRTSFNEDNGRSSLVHYLQGSRANLQYALTQAAKFPNIWMLHAITVVLVAAAGVIVPSVLSAFYLLSFYVTCTYWSSCRKVYNHKLAWTRVILIIYSALHLCLLYLYQFEYAQTILPEESFTARYCYCIHFLSNFLNLKISWTQLSRSDQLL